MGGVGGQVKFVKLEGGSGLVLIARSRHGSRCTGRRRGHGRAASFLYLCGKWALLSKKERQNAACLV